LQFERNLDAMIVHLRRAIRNSGQTQKRIAELSAVSEFRLCRILARRALPRPKERERIAHTLGMRVREPFGRRRRKSA